MVKIAEQNHASQYTIVVIIGHNMIGVILAQFEKCSLTNFQKLVPTIRIYVVRWYAIVLGVEKHKCYQHEPEKAEGVGDEVGEECESSHFQKTFFRGLNLPMKKTSTERRNPSVNGSFEFSHDNVQALDWFAKRLLFKWEIESYYY